MNTASLLTPLSPVAPLSPLASDPRVPAAADGSVAALITVGRELATRGYHFTTVTPETQRRINARPANQVAQDLRDVFGWSRAFPPGLLPDAILGPLLSAGAVEDCGGRYRSRVRFSTLAGHLHVHSAYPTLAADAVFFGPDTARFVAFITAVVGRSRCLVDVGCGSGAGGLALADRCSDVLLADINPVALRHAQVNAGLRGCAHARTVTSDVLAGIAVRCDVVIANPPYLADALLRTYRDGGGDLGTGLGVRIVREALARLPPGGHLALYTGAPVVAGVDRFFADVGPLLAAAGAAVDYREVDPDVFGDELDAPAYAMVERIAAVTLSAHLPQR